ncbi:MAG TPA: FecR domain-containing protein [Steroidobacteraceae bacterium]|jgi:FecR protein.|nr:FecR domain-containing protein [Steroidobacteraceae bacterium]
MVQFLRIASRSACLTLIAALFASLPLSAIAATPPARGDIVAVTVHGTVSATMAGMTVPLSAGAILQLPATVRTGADGAVELRQGNSTFAAAGNTELEIPQSAAEDGLVERIVQIRGNAFYNIGKRTGTRLRVEAPYLVAVIKGTQFNVAAQEDSTTIALFEGHLEVRASDESDVVDLEAGEIAIRRRNDVSISVLRLNAARGDARGNQQLAARPQADSPNPTSDAVTARNDDNASRPRVEATIPADGIAPRNDVNPTPTERERTIDTLPDASGAVAAKAAVVDIADVGTTVDVGAGSVAAAGNVGVDVGSVSADVNTNVSVDLPAGGVDVNAGVTAAAGEVVTADVGAGASVDVPAGAVDLGAAATVAAGDVAPVDVGADVGVDAGAGNLGADVNVGPVNVGLDVGSGGVGLDVGLDPGDDSGGGLLGGLLGRKNRN